MGVSKLSAKVFSKVNYSFKPRQCNIQAREDVKVNSILALEVHPNKYFNIHIQ